MANSTSSPQRPLTVKAVPTWRSIDGQFLGWFPGIFGTTEKFPSFHFMLPAVPDIDPWDTLEASLWETAEACMAAWEKAVPTELVKMGSPGPTAVKAINQQELYRDPSLLTAENPFEDELPQVDMEPVEDLAHE